MSKDMKMKIQIDGDNKGFKNTLRQTGRDIDQFQQKQSSGIGMSQLIGANLLSEKFKRGRQAMGNSMFRPSLDRLNKGTQRRNNLVEAARISERHGKD